MKGSQVVGQKAFTMEGYDKIHLSVRFLFPSEAPCYHQLSGNFHFNCLGGGVASSTTKVGSDLPEPTGGEL